MQLRRCALLERMTIRGLATDLIYCAKFDDNQATDKATEERTMLRNQNDNDGDELGLFDDLGYGGEFNPGYGALLGGGLTAAGILGAKALSKNPKVRKYSYLVGAALGGVATGVMYFQGHERAALLSGSFTALMVAAEAIREHVVVPRMAMAGYLGDDGIEMLDADDDGMDGYYSSEMQGLGAGNTPSIEMLGQATAPALGATPADVMGSMGLYQPEVAGYDGGAGY